MDIFRLGILYSLFLGHMLSIVNWTRYEIGIDMELINLVPSPWLIGSKFIQAT